MDPDFDLSHFLPYLLSQAADTTSARFQSVYKDRYGMLRTEWRVLFHLGRYGAQSAREICDRGRLHKTKVSRAVAGLEGRRFLTRATCDTDRRREILTLTAAGQAAFRDLSAEAQKFNDELAAKLTAQDGRVLQKALMILSEEP
ncbi:MAG: MarR family transcriptional regulator [Rhodobacterales bacterium]|nr:MAG: MarR family transcriptional regulator [Rhodobacterales bacterium]